MQNVDHPLWRNVSETWSIYANQSQVDATIAIDNFGDYKTVIYNSL